MSDEDKSAYDDRILTANIKLYYDVYIPSGDEKQRPLLIALHGYGANKRQMMREGRLIAPDGFAIASLQGFHQHIKEPKEEGGPLRYAFGWLTNFHPEDSVLVHHRAILDLINSLAQEEVIDEKLVFLLGFSQTCALNFRFAFTHPDVLRGVIGICGGIPGDWDASDLYQRTNASVLYLHGESDEFYPPARVQGYKEQLLKRAGDVQVKSYDAAHEITQAMRDDISAWLKERGAI